MKKRIWAFAMAGLMAGLLLAGCGSAGGSPAMSAPAASAPAMEATENMDYGWVSDQSSGTGSIMAGAPSEDGSGGPAQEAKRIYTAELSLETKAFDEAARKLEELVTERGGWFQETNVNDYGDGYRHGSYVVRVPSEKFQDFLTQVGALCHVTYQNTACEDVSEYYYDTAGRLKTQQTKLERLQNLLSQAENMEDIITIESAISETEQTIDSLSGELRYYDAQVDYSTVRLTLDEVYRLTDTEQPANGFAERFGTALDSGWKGFISGMQDILIFLAYGWMWLLLLAVIIILALILASRRRKKRAAAMQARKVEPIQLSGSGKQDDKSKSP